MNMIRTSLIPFNRARANGLPAQNQETGVGRQRLSLEDTQRLLDMFTASQNVKPSSRKTYRESMTQFFNWLSESGKELSTLTSRDLIEYMDALLRSGHQRLTVRSYMAAVRKFYAWTESEKLYPNIAVGVKAPKVNQGGTGNHFIKMHLDDRQGAELLEHFKNSPRNYAMVNLMLRTGLRTIEVSRARIGDIRMRSGKRILQVWGKGMDSMDPSVYVVLTDVAYAPIREYLSTRPGALPGEPLFTTEGKGYNKTRNEDYPDGTKPHAGQALSTRLIQLIIKNGLRAIGLDDHVYSAHSLRHTTATQIIRNGGTVLDVKRTLRHSSIDTSLIYMASIEEEERLAKAPETLLDGSFAISKETVNQ